MKKIDSIYVFAFPIILTIGILLIPVVPNYSDHTLAANAVENTFRWYAGHIISAVAFGISLLSVHSIKKCLEDQSYRIPDFIILLMAIGAGLYAAGLGADGIGPIAIKSSSLNPMVFFDGSGWWVSGTFMSATVFFGVGLISLVCHVNNAEMIKGFWRYVIFISAIIFVTVPAVPSGWGLYGEALASIGVFWPIGISIWHSS